MGRRGPPPTPTDVLSLRGSWRADVNPDEPRPPKGRPEQPSWLDADAAAAWEQLVPELEAMNVLTRIDGYALAVLCQTWAQWRKATDFIAKHGETYPVRDEAGRIKLVRKFPQVSIAAESARSLNRYFQEFGLTPSARSRITVNDRDDERHDKRNYLNVG